MNQHHRGPHQEVGLPAAGPDAAGAPPSGRRGVEPGPGFGTGPGPGFGSGALTRAIERWRRVMIQERERPPSAMPTPNSTPDADGLAALARRLDDSGCSYGRVSAARLEQVIRAYDRLETKMNAVLMAVTGTFLSTLAGLFLYYVRGVGQ